MLFMEVTENILFISYETASVFYWKLYNIIYIVLQILSINCP